jgi:hypothetical protein
MSEQLPPLEEEDDEDMCEFCGYPIDDCVCFDDDDDDEEED